VQPGAEEAFTALCGRWGVPAAVLGRTGGGELAVTAADGGGFAVSLEELAAAHQGTLPALFG
jgi:phosphoribosylformylglycinamidine (FGAM) synthase-like enzyme